MKLLPFLLMMMLLFGGCVDGNQRKDQVGETVVGQSMARAKDADCMSQLSQVRQSIEMAKSADPEGAVPDLTSLRLPAETLVCPIGKEPYGVNAEGTVKCPHLGHEKY